MRAVLCALPVLHRLTKSCVHFARCACTQVRVGTPAQVRRRRGPARSARPVVRVRAGHERRCPRPGRHPHPDIDGPARCGRPRSASIGPVGAPARVHPRRRRPLTRRLSPRPAAGRSRCAVASKLPFAIVAARRRTSLRSWTAGPSPPAASRWCTATSRNSRIPPVDGAAHRGSDAAGFAPPIQPVHRDWLRAVRSGGFRPMPGHLPARHDAQTDGPGAPPPSGDWRYITLHGRG